MNKKQLINAIIVLVVLGVISFFVFNKDTSSWQRGNTIEKQKLLKDFDVNKVAKFAITTDSDSLELAKDNDQKWKVVNRNGYPANFAKLSDFLLKLNNLDVAQYPRLLKSQFNSLKLIAPEKGTKDKDTGSLLTLSDKNNNVILSLIIGEQHFPKQNNNASYQMVRPDGCYVLIEGTDTPALVTDPLSIIDPDPQKWLDKDFITIPDMLSITLNGSDGKKKWKIYRNGIKKSWTLEGLKKGEKLYPRQMYDATSMFKKIYFDDVSPASEVELKDTQSVILESASGLIYNIKLLVKDKKVFAKIEISAKLASKMTPMKDVTPEAIKKQEEELQAKMEKIKKRLAEENLYTHWLYEFPTYKISKVLKERKNFYKPVQEEL